jgi:DNA-binding NtrC family response regulator
MDIKILIVDDEPYMTELIQRLIQNNTPYFANRVTQSERVLPLLEQDQYSLVFLDLRMPGMDGMHLLKEIKRRHPLIEVIIVTAYGTVGTAVEALQHGAADFVTKPFENQELLAVLDRMIRLQDLTRQNLALRRALAEKYSLDILSGHAPSMKELNRKATEAAHNGSPVILLGEFGTGKAFLARALHFSGPRASGPFLNLDLSSADPLDLERLIFGKRGAKGNEFQGLLASADGGSLHLANIELLPATLQNRLADWLEQGRFRPVDSEHLESSEVRLVLSTEKNLDELMEQGRLEKRLGFMAGQTVLCLPPLRARREDIILLAGRFLEKLGRLHNKQEVRLSDAALKRLLAHDWPGNLRELENTLERALLLSDHPVIQDAALDRPDDLGSHVFTLDVFALDQPFDHALALAKAKFSKEFEETYLQHHLAKMHGNLESVQTVSGLSKEKLAKMIAHNNFSLQRFQKGS